MHRFGLPNTALPGTTGYGMNPADLAGYGSYGGYGGYGGGGAGVGFGAGRLAVYSGYGMNPAVNLIGMIGFWGGIGAAALGPILALRRKDWRWLLLVPGGLATMTWAWGRG